MKWGAGDLETGKGMARGRDGDGIPAILVRTASSARDAGDAAGLISCQITRGASAAPAKTQFKLVKIDAPGVRPSWADSRARVGLSGKPNGES